MRPGSSRRYGAAAAHGPTFKVLTFNVERDGNLIEVARQSKPLRRRRPMSAKEDRRRREAGWQTPFEPPAEIREILPRSSPLRPKSAIVGRRPLLGSSLSPSKGPNGASSSSSSSSSNSRRPNSSKTARKKKNRWDADDGEDDDYDNDRFPTRRQDDQQATIARRVVFSSAPVRSTSTPQPSSAPGRRSTISGMVSGLRRKTVLQQLDQTCPQLAVDEFGRLPLEGQVRELFQMMDLNNDFRIKKNEIVAACRTNATIRTIVEPVPHLRFLLDPSVWTSVLKKIDTSTRHYITFSEFRNFIVGMSRRTDPARTKATGDSGEATNAALADIKDAIAPPIRRMGSRSGSVDQDPTSDNFASAVTKAKRKRRFATKESLESQAFGMIVGSNPGDTKVVGSRAQILGFGMEQKRLDLMRARFPRLALVARRKIWFRQWYRALAGWAGDEVSLEQFTDTLQSIMMSLQPTGRVSARIKSLHQLFDAIRLSVGNPSDTLLSKVHVVNCITHHREIQALLTEDLVHMCNKQWIDLLVHGHSSTHGKIGRREFVKFFSEVIDTHMHELGLQRKTTYADEEQLSKLRRAFDLIDSDGSNSLSIKELLAAIKSPETLEAMLRACPSLRSLLQPERWFHAFMAVPTDENGEVTFQGFRRFCERSEESFKQDDDGGIGKDAHAKPAFTLRLHYERK